MGVLARGAHKDPPKRRRRGLTGSIGKNKPTWRKKAQSNKFLKTRLRGEERGKTRADETTRREKGGEIVTSFCGTPTEATGYIRGRGRSERTVAEITDVVEWGGGGQE